MKAAPAWLVVPFVLPLVVPGGQAEESWTDEATFRYALGTQVDGRIEGHCESPGVAFQEGPPIPVNVSASRVQLALFRTWINWTVLFPGTPREQVVQVTGRQERENLSEAAGSWRVVLGHGVVLPTSSDAPRLDFDLAGSRLAAQPVVSFVSTGLAYPSPFDDRRVMFVQYPVDGPVRVVETDREELVGHGDFFFLLDEALLEGPGEFRLQLPPYRQTVWRGEVPGVGLVVTQLYTHARLLANDARLELAAHSTRLACAGLDLRVDGAARFHGATGQVTHAEQQIPFPERELDLRGTFRVQERLVRSDGGGAEGGWSESRASGRFTAVGLDYENLPLSPYGTEFPASAAWVLGLAGVVALLSQWSRLVGLFYTRFNESKALEHPTRAHLWAAIEETPGLILAILAQRLGRPLGVIRHHVRILEVVGLVKSLRVGSARHLYPKTYSLPVARRQERWGRDAPARFLVERLKETPLSLTGARHEVRIHFGFSRMGAWKVVRRAVQDGLVRVEPENHTLRPVA